jgi:hypothetical protein
VKTVKAPKPRRTTALKAAGGEGADEAVPIRELRAARLEKVGLMKAAGVNPYAYKFNPTHSAESFAAAFKALGA